MSDPNASSDYLVGRFFVSLVALGSIVIFVTLGWEVHAGEIHNKFGVIFLDDDPTNFWIDVGCKAAIALLFACRRPQTRFHMSARPVTAALLQW